MKKLLLIVVLVAMAVGTQARVWTSADGKEVEADLIRVKGGKVYLKVVSTRRIHPFELSKLSQEDQEYIANYQKEAVANEAAAKKEAQLAKRKAKWHDDVEDALEESKEVKMPIFVLITAPEWCGYCVKLEDEILKKSAFKRFSNMNLVLLEVDCSASGSYEKWKKKNPEMAKKCPSTGYPSAFLIGVDGSVLGKFGYEKVSPDAYAAKIKAKIK